MKGNSVIGGGLIGLFGLIQCVFILVWMFEIAAWWSLLQWSESDGRLRVVVLVGGLLGRLFWAVATVVLYCRACRAQIPVLLVVAVGVLGVLVAASSSGIGEKQPMASSGEAVFLGLSYAVIPLVSFAVLRLGLKNLRRIRQRYAKH